MTQIIDLGKLRFHFAGEWSSSTTYEPNDIVKYGGNVYVYTYALKTTNKNPQDTNYWALMVEGFKFRGTHDSIQQYRVGDAVTHGGKVYVCIQDSLNVTPPNATYWSQFVDGIQFEGAYDNATPYQKNDVVTYGSNAFVAKYDTLGNLPSDAAFWTPLVSGVSAKGVWNAQTAYVVNDLVAYGGFIYRALRDVTGATPTEVSNPANWAVFIEGAKAAGTWTTGQEYAPGDLVTYGGSSYICKVFVAASDFAAELALSKWEKFNGGVNWRGIWQSGVEYRVDDVVTDEISAFICKATVTSTTVPKLDLANWEFLVKGATGVPASDSTTDGKVLMSNDSGPYWQYVSRITPAFVATQF